MWTEIFVHEKLKWKTILFLFCSCFLMASAGASPLFSFNEAVQMSLVPMPLNSNTCSFLLLWFILHFAGSTKVFWLCAKGLWGAMTAKRLKRFQSGQSRDKSQICQWNICVCLSWKLGVDAASNLRPHSRCPSAESSKTEGLLWLQKISMGMLQGTKQAFDFFFFCLWPKTYVCQIAQWAWLLILFSHIMATWNQLYS